MNNKDHKQQQYRFDTKQLLAFSVAVKEAFGPSFEIGWNEHIPAYAVLYFLTMVWNEYIPAYVIFQRLTIALNKYIPA